MPMSSLLLVLLWFAILCSINAQPPTMPTTLLPTARPTARPTTGMPSTFIPTTFPPSPPQPTTAMPATFLPTTFAPTASPTAATDTPSSSPTNVPTAAPTSSPTVSPTAAPTNVPTKTPTAPPTTASPTANPITFEPTSAPTTAAPTTAAPTTPTPTTAAPTTASPTTASPTTAPHTSLSPTTLSPTTLSPEPPDCPYILSLIYIGLVTLQDCLQPAGLIRPPTDAPTSKAIDAWYSRDGSDSSDSSRRRLGHLMRRRDLVWDPLRSSSSEYDSEQCLAPDGDPLVFVDTLCHDGYDASFFSSADYDPGTQDFLAPICIYYDVRSLTPATDGVIDSIWLALCENGDTGFDSSLLGVDDLTRIISATSAFNVATAVGDRVNGVLGIRVTLIDATQLSFALCFDTVAVTSDFNEHRYEIEISSNGVMSVRYTSPSPQVLECDVVGLPCLNYFFGCKEDLVGPEEGAALQNSVSCDCNQALTTIYVQYTGTQSNVRVVGFMGQTGDTMLCSTSNVNPGDVVECNAADNAGYTAFGRHTRFAVYSVDSAASCEGVVQSDCETQLVGTTVALCDDLLIYAWIDASVAFCDRIVLEWQQQQDGSGDNAVIAQEVKSENKDMLRTFSDMYPYIRWALICTLVMFVVLLLISAYICFVRAKIENMHAVPGGRHGQLATSTSCIVDDDAHAHAHVDEEEDTIQGTASHSNTSSLDDVAKDIAARSGHHHFPSADDASWSMAKLRRVIIRRRQRRLMTDEDIMSTIHYNTPQMDPNAQNEEAGENVGDHDKDGKIKQGGDPDHGHGDDEDEDEVDAHAVSTVFTDEFMEDDNTTLVAGIATPLATDDHDQQPQLQLKVSAAYPSMDSNVTLYRRDVYFEDDNASMIDRIPAPVMTERSSAKNYVSHVNHKLQLLAHDSARTDENSKIPIYKVETLQHGKVRANTMTTTTADWSLSANVDSKVSNDLHHVVAHTSTHKVTV